MWVNIIHILAQFIEETTRQDQSVVGKSFKFMLNPCLSDKLVLPLRAICNNPIISLLVVLLLYLVFLIVYLPLWISSFVVTTYGAWLIFVIAFHFLGITIARAIAFPGSNSSTIKQMSSDTIRRLADYMENSAVATKETASSMVLIANGKLGREQLEANIFAMNQIWPAVEFFPHIKEYFDDAIEQLQAEQVLTAEELKVIQQLCNGLDECYAHFKELFQFAISSHGRNGTSNSASSSFAQTLLILSARCLNSSEKVRSNAHTIKPSGGGSEDDYVSGAVKAILSLFTSSLTGFERLSFPYLRAILKKQHKAETVQIQGSDGNRIDGLLLRTAHDPRRTGANSKDNSASPEAKTMVIFCCPNAGFYECISQFNFDKSWFGYYLSLGMDVFVYNYRGYGRSQGLPTPTLLRKDSLAVLEYLRFTYKPANIVIHGESIGGMVACYLARHGDVKALVCDRTFSSLDAAASRLMGNWAGNSLRYIALWQTDCVDDFLQAKCAKIVLQDPNDEIIADPASLRAGIASQLVYGHKSNLVVSENARYATERYLHTADVSPPTEESAWFLHAENATMHLPEEFVMHLFACCKHILERGVLFDKGDASNPSNSDHNRSASGDVSQLLQHQLATIELVQRKGGHAETHNSHLHNILQAEGPVDEESIPLVMRSESNGSDDEGATDGNESKISTTRNKISTNDEFVNRMHSMVRRRYIERMLFTELNRSDGGNSELKMNPHLQCWIALSRISHHCGQYLGEAVGRGPDSCRTWVASFIVWNHSMLEVTGNASGNPTVNANSAASEAAITTVRRAIADLEYLSQVAYVNELRSSHAVNFVLKALRVLFKRNQCFLSVSSAEFRQYGSGHTSEHLPSAAPPSIWASGCSQNSVLRPVDPMMLGKVLPLQCGHNGWPEDEDIDRLSLWFNTVSV